MAEKVFLPKMDGLRATKQIQARTGWLPVGYQRATLKVAQICEIDE